MVGKCLCRRRFVRLMVTNCSKESRSRASRVRDYFGNNLLVLIIFASVVHKAFQVNQSSLHFHPVAGDAVLHYIDDSSAFLTLNCTIPSKDWVNDSKTTVKLYRVLDSRPDRAETLVYSGLDDLGKVKVSAEMADRFQAFGGLNRNFVAVNLTHLRCNDSGTYACQLSSSKRGNLTAYSKVFVQVLPEMVNGTKSVRLNEEVIFTCQVYSTKNVTWQWQVLGPSDYKWKSVSKDQGNISSITPTNCHEPWITTLSVPVSKALPFYTCRIQNAPGNSWKFDFIKNEPYSESNLLSYISVSLAIGIFFTILVGFSCYSYYRSQHDEQWKDISQEEKYREVIRQQIKARVKQLNSELALDDSSDLQKKRNSSVSFTDDLP